MARQDYSEDKLNQTLTADKLKDLGWDSVYAMDAEGLGADSLLGRTARHQVILEREVMAALKRLNPGVPEKSLRKVLEEHVVNHVPGKSLIQQNQEKYRMLRDGIPISYTDASGRRVDRLIRLIDFRKPENNHFVAVRELWIEGKYGRKRPDVIGFVNGLPLVFIELKRQDVPLAEAYTGNLSDYKSTIPQLFAWNALLVLSNGMDARYGSISASLEHFYTWKRQDEDDPEPSRDKPLLPVLLDGLLAKDTLLDMVENFTVFDASAESVQKIVARNHQYLGVNRVIARLTEQDDPTIRAELAEGKLGVFWHTQGSGKSYSMVFLTEKIHRKISSRWRFVLITDRTELDEQIAGTYAGCGIANPSTDQAQNGRALRKMLQEENRRYTFALIQKFREKPKTPYSTRDDIIVISDEAHRTQNGILATNMRTGLPNAKFLGMTGTPLIESAEKQLTRQLFGDYVSIYDFQRAVADGATLPLYYESTGERLHITDPDMSRRIAEYIECEKRKATEDGSWTDEKEGRLIAALSKEYQILTSAQRLEKIARHFVDHFHQRWNVVKPGGGKAMLVCVDKITCVRMYDLITELWQEKLEALEQPLLADEQRFREHGKQPNTQMQLRRQQVEWMRSTECCVVVSQDQGEIEHFSAWKNHRDEALDIRPHREKMAQRKLELEFKEAGHPFRIAIVCAMWLTGFDVKCLSTLYLDKPMQGHTLMQAIARANRVGHGKRSGLVVDYNGMVKALREALATFASGERAGSGKGEESERTIQDTSVALAEYVSVLNYGISYLGERGFALETLTGTDDKEAQLQALKTAANLLCEKDQYREAFNTIVNDLESRHRALIPEPGLFLHDGNHRALLAIRNTALKRKPLPNIGRLLSDLHDFVDMGVEVKAEERFTPADRWNLSQVDIPRLQAEFEKTPHKAMAVASLRDRIEAKLHEMLPLNPGRIDLQERYQEIVKLYNRDKDRGEIQKVFDELCALSSRMSEEDLRCAREQLNDEAELAVFDMLAKPCFTQKDRDAAKDVARGLLKNLREIISRMHDWRAKATTQAKVKASIHENLELLPESHYDLDNIADLTDRVFVYVRDTPNFEHLPIRHH